MFQRLEIANDATPVPARGEIKLYGDGAALSDFAKLYADGVVSGFTTNPSLMRRAGVTDYESYARELIAMVPDMPISFEVIADEFRKCSARPSGSPPGARTSISRSRSPIRAASRACPW
ncbi:hypothetical protein [Phenylobacterium aquaticum]|uniref:hypothetical protein n=1 Tax=Phenylobacterium aquaticum TaxID=1763816 RepID=UPI001F5C2A09|nr:hypothetical protein [Phenylobacterium aquaticum]MCI3132681.1 hypothetical protein [Phenylobacterium aquaticum]